MSRDVLERKPLSRRIIYGGLYYIAQITPLCIMLFCGYVLGLLAWCFDKNGKKNVRENLMLLMPNLNQLSIERMVRKIYINFGIACSELLIIPRLKKKHFKQTRIIDPWGQLSEKPVAGPLIGVTVHCNWEIMPCILHRLGYFRRCHTIALSHEDRVIDTIFHKIRDSMGVNSLLLDRAPLETLRALKAGGILALVGDRDYTQHGMSKKIGGGTMNLPVGPAALAIQTNAPIIPVFTCRTGAVQHTVICAKAIRPNPELSKREQLPQIMNELAHMYERFLLTAPSQWVCFHKAFEENADKELTAAEA